MAEWSNALVLKTSVPRGTGGSNPSLSAQTPENQRFTLVFLCPYANEDRFSERDGYKKYRTPEADWFSCVFGTVPLQGSFERSEKNPSHRSDWDQIYPLLLSFKQEDLSLQEQFLQPEFRFSLRRFSAPSFSADFSSNQPDLLNITSRGV